MKFLQHHITDQTVLWQFTIEQAYTLKVHKVQLEDKQGLSPCVAKYPPPPTLCCVPSDTKEKAKMLLSVNAHFVIPGFVIRNSTSANPVWLPRDQWYRRDEIHKDSIKF